MTKSLKTIREIVSNSDGRLPMANITDNNELFGDPFSSDPGSNVFGDPYEFGDVEDEGDPYGDLYGDADDEYGDLYGDVDDNEVLDLYSTTAGDVDDYGMGGPKLRSLWQKTRKPLAIAGAGTAAFLAGRAIAKGIKRRRARRAATLSRLKQSRLRQTIATQRNAQRNAPKIARTNMLPFYQISGATLNSYPISPRDRFIADMYKNNLDRQALDTPFLQETAAGTLVGTDWVCTATGVATPRYYNLLAVRIGINALAGAPGTIFSITASLPLFNNTVTVTGATPWVFTIGRGFDVTFAFFPWQLIANRPQPALGSYDNTVALRNIVVTVSGLPAASAVTLIVLGSLHPTTIATRTALI